MTPLRQEMLAELEATIAKMSSERRLAILRQVTDLFLDGSIRYSPEQVAVFDAIMKALIKDIESRALIELSSRLSTADSPPVNIVVRLSYDNNLAVAGPVLEKSTALEDVNLIDVARTKGQGHRLAIASRPQINVVVTDALVEKGESAVMRKVTANDGAAFSENSFARLVNEARKDQDLAGLMAKRTDVPPELQPFIKLALT